MKKENNQTNPNKPLGGRTYGSIPHLPGSRLGPGDHHISEGQALIATVKKRDKHDQIYVQEKLDGSNVAIAKVNGQILALTRAGYLASTSPFEQHHHFSRFVSSHERIWASILKNGERICGEWIAQAHGTRYGLSHHPLAQFVAFDLFRNGKRLMYNDFISRVSYNIPTPSTYRKGDFGAVSIAEAQRFFGPTGHHGALDEIEGYIWRVERHGEVDFLTKYVRPDKIDGKYLPENNGTGQPIWNI